LPPNFGAVPVLYREGVERVISSSLLDELLPAVDVVSTACQGRVGHNVHGERRYVGRANDAPDRQRSAELLAARIKLIAEQRCRQGCVDKPSR